MKKKSPVIIVIFLLFAAAAVLYGSSTSDAVVDSSGVVIDQTKPENTITSYHELIGKKRYKPAALLQTKKSQELIKPEDLGEQYKNVNLTSARLAKVFEAETKGDIAVVGDIRLVRFTGNDFDSAILGITVLSAAQGSGKWEIVSSLEEVGKENYLDLFQLLVALDKKILKAQLAEEGFTDRQVSSIKEQAKGMTQFHEEQMKEYKKYLAAKKGK